MTDLIANLQMLGDMEHDDLSVAHDALSEIIKLRLEKARLNEVNAELVEALKRMKLEKGFVCDCGIESATWDLIEAIQEKTDGSH